MSILKTGQVIADSWTNSDGTENFKCRAFINFSAATGTPVIGSSGNISSISDDAAGVFTVNFARPMPSRNYACAFGWAAVSSNYVFGVRSTKTNDVPLLKTTSSITLNMTTTSSGPTDGGEMSMIVVGG